MRMTQLSLTDALQRKEEGQAKVLQHAGEEWMIWAIEEMLCQFASGETFTVDDLHARAQAQAAEPRHSNAWGAAFSAAAKHGLIERVGYAKSARPASHARVVAVWRRK